MYNDWQLDEKTIILKFKMGNGKSVVIGTYFHVVSRRKYFIHVGIRLRKLDDLGFKSVIV